MKQMRLFPLKRWVLATLALVILSTSARADIPFQPLLLPDGATGGSPTDMNASGVIVGLVYLNNQAEPAVWLSTAALPTILPTEGRGGFAAAINSAGQVAGVTSDGVIGVPTVWENEVPVVLPHLGEGGNARDISESGIVCGFVVVNGDFVAARWVNRELQLLPVETAELGEVGYSIAESINSSDVISGTIRKAGSTESLAVRWDSEGIKPVLSSGLETKGISIDNLGGVLVNGYFDGGYTSQPARVLPDGTIDILTAPPEITSTWGLAMSRTGVACGYYWDFSGEERRLKAVAWVDGKFNALELPSGNRYSVPLGVGINGVVIGSVTTGDWISTPGFWELPVEETFLQSRTVTASPGQTIQLTTTSARASGVNVGQSVQVRVAGQSYRVVTDKDGVASVPFTIPARTKGRQIAVQYIDETGARSRAIVRIIRRPKR
jgi:uncharacterized membrane protein